MNLTQTPQELEVILGDHIKAIRLQKNLDRRTLCQQAGVSETALRHLENGQGATLKTFIRILKSLGYYVFAYDKQFGKSGGVAFVFLNQLIPSFLN